jgi:hypothetical protein
MAGRRTALLVATDRYQDPGLRRLNAPTQDAEALKRVLEDPDIAGFDVTLLLNEPLHVVGEAVGELYESRGRQDLTLLYFSGHGLKDDAGRLYLAMTNTRRESLLFTALSAHQIDEAIDSCASRQKVLVLDCCYSGAFPSGRIAKGDSQVHALEQFQGRGRVVLTASDATQYSFEGDRVIGSGSRSVFTKYFVEGLETGQADLDQDGNISLDELYSYVHDRVIEEMPQQRPKKQEHVEGRIIVGRNTHWTLPAYLSNAIDSPFPRDRLSALDGLAHLHRVGSDLVQARALAEIRRLGDDDSKAVSTAAIDLLRVIDPDRERARDEARAHREAEERRQAQAALEAEERRQAQAALEAEERKQAQAALEAEERKQAQAALEAEERKQAQAALEAEERRQAQAALEAEERRTQPSVVAEEGPPDQPGNAIPVESDEGGTQSRASGEEAVADPAGAAPSRKSDIRKIGSVFAAVVITVGVVITVVRDHPARPATSASVSTAATSTAAATTSTPKTAFDIAAEKYDALAATFAPDVAGGCFYNQAYLTNVGDETTGGKHIRGPTAETVAYCDHLIAQQFASAADATKALHVGGMHNPGILYSTTRSGSCNDGVGRHESYHDGKASGEFVCLLYGPETNPYEFNWTVPARKVRIACLPDISPKRIKYAQALSRCLEIRKRMWK